MPAPVCSVAVQARGRLLWDCGHGWLWLAALAGTENMPRRQAASLMDAMLSPRWHMFLDGESGKEASSR